MTVCWGWLPGSLRTELRLRVRWLGARLRSLPCRTAARVLGRCCCHCDCLVVGSVYLSPALLTWLALQSLRERHGWLRCPPYWSVDGYCCLGWHAAVRHSWLGWW